MIKNTYEEAERCEKSHLSAISVRELEYKYGAYPCRVALIFSDGREQIYTADDSLYFRNDEVNHANDKNIKNDKDKEQGKKHKNT